MVNKAPFGWRDTAAPTLSLFASAATLVCCALPALLVSLGMGAVMAGLVADIPQLVWLSRHKAAVFAGAGLLLLAAGAMLWHARHRPCPANPAQARACTRLRRISMGVYALSILLFAVGLFFAYGAGLVWG